MPAAGIAIAVLLLFAPSLAGASSSYVNAQGTLFYFADPGEINDLTIAVEGADYVVTDPGAVITPAAGCAAVSATQIKCVAANVKTLDLRLGDLNDRANVAASVTGLEAPFGPEASIEGELGDDRITGGPNVANSLYGDDSFFAGSGKDTLVGGNLADEVIGGSGDDILRGGGDRDQLDGGDGDDLVDGGTGPDFIAEGPAANGADRLIGGAGSNVVSYDDRGAGVRVSLNGLADDGEAGEGDNVNDQFSEIRTGSGNDSLSGSGQSMSFSSGDGNDSISAGSGNDDLFAGQGDDNLAGGAGPDRLSGSDGDDLVDGGPGDDTLLDGSGDGDTVGADQYRGGSGTDRLVYDVSEPLMIDLDGVADDGRAGEGDLAGADLEDLVGGPKADVLIGNNAANQIDGGSGNDQISGLGGPDALLGEDGDDHLEGGEGIDLIDGAGGADQLRSRDSSPDQVACGSSADVLFADSLDEFTLTCDQSSTGASIKGSQARLNRKGKAKLKVNCPALEGVDCKVKLTATQGKKTLAKGSGKVKSGQTGKITVKLTKAGKKRRAKKLVVKVRSVFTDAAGARVATTVPKLVLKR